MHDVRYVVIGIGDPDEPVTEEEVQFLQGIVEQALPMFESRVLSKRVSNKLTLALMQEEGLL
jgi:ClpP class serine protease